MVAPGKQVARKPEANSHLILGCAHPICIYGKSSPETQKDAHEDTEHHQTHLHTDRPTCVHLSSAAPWALRPQNHLRTSNTSGVGKPPELRHQEHNTSFPNIPQIQRSSHSQSKGNLWATST